MTDETRDRSPSDNQQDEPQAVDPQDLVYLSSYSRQRGAISEDPREIINNPAVAPETLDTTPENLRDDFIKQSDTSES